MTTVLSNGSSRSSTHPTTVTTPLLNTSHGVSCARSGSIVRDSCCSSRGSDCCSGSGCTCTAGRNNHKNTTTGSPPRPPPPAAAATTSTAAVVGGSIPRASSNLELLSQTAAWQNYVDKNPARVSPTELVICGAAAGATTSMSTTKNTTNPKANANTHTNTHTTAMPPKQSQHGPGWNLDASIPQSPPGDSGANSVHSHTAPPYMGGGGVYASPSTIQTSPATPPPSQSKAAAASPTNTARNDHHQGKSHHPCQNDYLSPPNNVSSLAVPVPSCVTTTTTTSILHGSTSSLSLPTMGVSHSWSESWSSLWLGAASASNQAGTTAGGATNTTTTTVSSSSSSAAAASATPNHPTGNGGSDRSHQSKTMEEDKNIQTNHHVSSSEECRGTDCTPPPPSLVPTTNTIMNGGDTLPHPVLFVPTLRTGATTQPQPQYPPNHRHDNTMTALAFGHHGGSSNNNNSSSSNHNVLQASFAPPPSSCPAMTRSVMGESGRDGGRPTTTILSPRENGMATSTMTTSNMSQPPPPPHFLDPMALRTPTSSFDSVLVHPPWIPSFYSHHHYPSPTPTPPPTYYQQQVAPPTTLLPVPSQQQQQQHIPDALLDELARDNALLRHEVNTKNKTISELERRIDELEDQVAELRQLPVGKISQIPVSDMIELMQIYGSEVSDHTHLSSAMISGRRKVQKASIVRQFRRWNPNFHEHFRFENGKWIPKLGHQGELERRIKCRSERRLQNKKMGAMMSTTPSPNHQSLGSSSMVTSIETMMGG